MNLDTQELAARLAGEHGIDGAIDLASKAIVQCHKDNDFFRLSVWREIRRDLRAGNLAERSPAAA